MKSLLRALTISICFATTAHADFSGDWVGTGTAKDNGNWQAPCNPMEFKIAQTPATLMINYGHYKCGNELESTWSPVTLTIHGNQLISKGKVVGTINQQNIHAENNDPQIRQVIDVTLTNAGLTYNETMTANAQKYILTVQGQLQKH